MRRIPLVFLFALLSAAWLAAADVPARKLVPVPDIPGYKTLKADVHLHTVFSDGNVWPTVRVSEAWRDGLDVIAITDHAEYHPHERDLKVDNARAYEIANHAAGQMGIIVIPGVEITKNTNGHASHFNALFVKDANALSVGDFSSKQPLADLSEALRRASGQGAFVIWNHPGFMGAKAEWWPDIDKLYGEGFFQGMEMVNTPYTYPDMFGKAVEKQLSLVAGSDAHQAMDPREASGQLRAITLIFAKTADLAGIREAMFSRRTAAWYNGEVWGPEQYLRPLAEASLSLLNSEIAVPLSKGTAPLALQFRNSSAIPFSLRLVNAPAWLHAKVLEVPGEHAVVLTGEMSPPPGLNRVELEFEATNIHVTPTRNAHIRIPLSVNAVQ